MKRILLPTDFSENANNAIRYAIALLKEVKCEFYLLHTYTPVIASSGSILDSYSALAIQNTAYNTAKKQLDALEERMLREFPNNNHRFICIASFNTLIAEMKVVIEKNSIDYVVMGTQGATGAKEVFLGTHTMYAIRKLKCPVLAVPEGYVYETPKEILFPTDYKIHQNNKYLSMLKELCDLHIARLHLLNAYYGTPLTEAQLDTKAYLDTYFQGNAHLFHMAEGTDVLEAVEQFQLKLKINFIVMVHNKHNFLENMLFTPVINQVVYHTHVPFLVIPSIERQ